MSTAEACLKLVDDLPGSLVDVLIAHLRGGPAVMPHPGYQGQIDEFLCRWSNRRLELAPMLEVALAAKRAAPSMELVWTGPPTAAVAARRTEQVLFDLIRCAQSTLTITSFGIFQIPRLVEELESALERSVSLRIIVGDRDGHADTEIARQRHQLGEVVVARATILQWAPDRRPRDASGHAGLMHAKAAVADSRVAFLTSANLTEAALERNMELGVLIRGGSVPEAIERLVNALVEFGELKPASVLGL